MSSLADLRAGQRGRVSAVEGIDEVSLRLLEMGLTPGVDLKLIGMAPMGDPLEVEVRGYRLSLRKSEARRVGIEPLDK